MTPVCPALIGNSTETLRAAAAQVNMYLIDAADFALLEWAKLERDIRRMKRDANRLLEEMEGE